MASALDRLAELFDYLAESIEAPDARTTATLFSGHRQALASSHECMKSRQSRTKACVVFRDRMAGLCCTKWVMTRKKRAFWLLLAVVSRPA